MKLRTRPRGMRATLANPRDCTLELHAERLIAQHELIPREEQLVVAVSGGPDSVALLDFLVARREHAGAPREIVVGHVNHGLRGFESEEDEAFVEALAKRLALRCLVERVDARQRSDRSGESLEESARKLRYAALRRMADTVDAERAAVAHTADDQAETVLLRLIRGAGLTGLGGMRPRRAVHGLTLVRPFLTTSREEVLDYAKRRNLSYRTDSTNASIDPRRNFVRLRVLPGIQELNPSIRETLLREAALFREADGHLTAEAETMLPEVLLKRSQGKIELDAERLLLYPELLRKYVVRFVLQEWNGDTLDLSSAHIDALHSLLTSRPGRSVDIPRGIQARRERGKLVLSRREPESTVGSRT